MDGRRDGASSSERPTQTPRWRVYAYDLVSSVVAVGLVGAFLFAVSGVWPPLVAIESGSMDPHIEKGDLVFVVEEERFPGDRAIADTGVVTARSGERTGYRTFRGHGDVVVYQPDGNARETPIIHRATFWVEAGENWVAEADPEYLGGATDCSEVATCPANHSGFVTLGDANSKYDQVSRHPGCDGYCDPVKPRWVVGTAEVRVPELGFVRLRAIDESATGSPSRDRKFIRATARRAIDE
ncbi:S26 family signal peptidase [Halomicrobium salinisoli]|uniref:S26 family signal peptidase n=1 Tax=Halomicrobium salinisoli TaxID=2878391 RepID=UPI001CF006D3|nr:S26 family signal peptidase [Halomicrobium salinisoli]